MQKLRAVMSRVIVATLVVAGTSLSYSPLGYSDVYKWYDTEGNVNYGEHPSEGVESQLFLKTTPSGNSQRVDTGANHHQSIKNYLDTVDARQQHQQPQHQQKAQATQSAQKQQTQQSPSVGGQPPAATTSTAVVPGQASPP